MQFRKTTKWLPHLARRPVSGDDAPDVQSRSQAVPAMRIRRRPARCKHCGWTACLGCWQRMSQHDDCPGCGRAEP